jgi:hypothetical protein
MNALFGRTLYREPQHENGGSASMDVGQFGAQPLSPPARKALIAGCMGFAVDLFGICCRSWRLRR